MGRRASFLEEKVHVCGGKIFSFLAVLALKKEAVEGGSCQAHPDAAGQKPMTAAHVKKEKKSVSRQEPQVGDLVGC